MTLKSEVEYLWALGFVETSPLVFCLTNEYGTLIFSYRNGSQRKSWAIAKDGKPIHKTLFEEYNTFKQKFK